MHIHESKEVFAKILHINFLGCIAKYTDLRIHKISLEEFLTTCVHH